MKKRPNAAVQTTEFGINNRRLTPPSCALQCHFGLTLGTLKAALFHMGFSTSSL